MNRSNRLVASADDEMPNAGAASQSPRQPLEGKHVLLLDPDADMLDVMSCALETFGAAVSAHRRVPSIDVLLDWAQQADCIVSELNLDGSNGYELIAQIRNTVDGARLPALALATSFNPYDEARALSAGFQSFLHKPVRLGQLESVLSRLVSNAGQVRLRPPSRCSGADASRCTG